MAFYRKKPVVIQAIQFVGGNESKEEIYQFVKDKTSVYGLGIPAHAIDIVTLEGTMTASIGDWIIKGVAGEFYPCKNEIFEKTYEPA